MMMAMANPLLMPLLKLKKEGELGMGAERAEQSKAEHFCLITFPRSQQKASCPMANV
jgi:hypothetical protein